MQEEDAKRYMEMLQKRVMDIQLIIDSHFDLIRDTIIKDKHDLIKKKERKLLKENKKKGYTA